MTRPVAALISCVSGKLNKPASAIDLYTSDLFLKSRRFAESYHLPIFILSAKHGLLFASTVIAPYNETLNNMTSSQIEEWGRMVGSDVRKEFGDQPLMVLAGKKYLAFQPFCDNQIIKPLGDLPIGKRLAYLKTHTRTI
jgi:hypothetical protein